MEVHKIHCNILIYGTLSSGSSAVHNLLKEYDNIGYLANEFDDYRSPGLVADQLSYSSSVNFPNEIDKITLLNNSIKKVLFKSLIWKLFLCGISNKYLDINIKLLSYIRNGLIGYSQILLLKNLNKNLKSSISFEKKIDFSNKWINDIGNIFSNHIEYMMFDQPINLTSEVSIWTKVFNPFKLIIIYRDPRDQLADIEKRGLLFMPFGSAATNLAGVNLDYIYGRDRKGATRFQIDAIRVRLKKIEYLEKILGKDNLLLIDFEGLVNNYKVYKTRIEDFVGGIKDNHRYKTKFFNPLAARANIGIYKKYLDEEDLKELVDLQDWYLDKIKLINSPC